MFIWYNCDNNNSDDEVSKDEKDVIFVEGRYSVVGEIYCEISNLCCNSVGYENMLWLCVKVIWMVLSVYLN